MAVDCVDNEPRIHAHDGSYYCSGCYDVVISEEVAARSYWHYGVKTA